MKCEATARWFAAGALVAVLALSLHGCTGRQSGGEAPASATSGEGGANSPGSIPEFGIHVTLPQGCQWRTSGFQWSAPGTLAEWISADGQTAGILARSDADCTIEQFADGSEQGVLKLEGVKCYVRTAEEKLGDKKPGTWLLREHLKNYRDSEYREVIVIVKQGLHFFYLATWCYEPVWAQSREAVYRTARSFECTGVPTPGFAGASPSSNDPILALKRTPGDPEPEGLYSLDSEIAFNVLDGAVWDEKRGTITLYGHWDDKYAGPRIFWLHHLAEMLDRPDPEFSLDWTPDSEKRVDHFLETSETPAEVKRVTDQWGDIIDEKTGTVSAVGRIMIPLLGLSVTANGSAPGTAGMQVRDTADGIRVDSVEPGSPAAAGDVRVGDIIKTFGHPSAIDARHLTHQIRASGAGATVNLGVRRGSGGTQWRTLLLRAASGDPWAGATGNDVAASIFRAAGMKDAGDVTYSVELMERVQATSHRDDALLAMIGALGLGQKWVDLNRQVNDGEITSDQAQVTLTRDMVAGLDRAYQFQGNPASAAWEKAYGRSQDLEKALGEAFDVVDQRRKESLRAAFQKLLQKPEGIQIPPELIELTYSIHMEVKPDYRHTDPSSQLARVMFESDYVMKRLVNSPSLKAVIPGYQTMFEFFQRMPNARVDAGKSTTFRMWISCQKLDAAESADGSTLEVREAKMQINVRELDRDKQDLPPTPGGYQALLTSLYDDFSVQIPVLHEIRECAKIAAVARWAKSKKPDLALPKEGRAPWHGPATMPGLIWMYLFPPKGPMQFDEEIVAMGGCSLKLPLTPFPKDSGVVDLSGSSMTMTPQAYNNETLSRVMGRKTNAPPEWHPEGWVTPARKGDRILCSLNVSIDAFNRDPKASLELAAKLEEARQAAERLAQVEHAINIITSKNIDRQKEFRELGDSLKKSEDEFIANALALLTSDLSSLAVTPELENAVHLSEEVQAARDKFQDMQERVRKAQLLWKAGTDGDNASRADAIKMLNETMRDLIAEAKPGSLGPLRRYLAPVGKTLNVVKKLERVYNIGQDLYVLRTAGNRIEELNLEVDKEGQALRDKLLPLQRERSDRLDQLRKDPEIRRATGG